MTIGVAAVAAVAVVVAGGVFAWSKLSGGGPQPAEAIPSDAMAYVRLDLDPSASQKLDAMSLLHKWPEFEEATGIAEDDVDLRELFVDEVIASDGCDVDYGDDIEPWIGDRLGFALVAHDDMPAPMLAVQVSDEDKAEAGAEKLAACAGSLGMPGSATMSSTSSTMADEIAYSEDDANLGVAFSGEYMIVAPTQVLADDLVKEAETESLAANDEFNEDMDALGDEGIASMWFDAEAFADAAEQSGMVPPEELEAFKSQDVGSGAAALRAGDDYLELVSVSDSPVGTEGDKADVGELSESTLFAASVSNGRSLVENSWTQLEGGLGGAAPELDFMLDDIESQTGLTLPDDLATLLGEQFLVAVDGEGLDAEMEPGSIEDINAGMRLTSDPAELSGVIDKVENVLVGMGGPSLSEALVREETDDGMVLATNEDYATMLTDGGGDLGDSDVYQQAVPAGDDAVNVVYVNLDEITRIAPESEEDVEMIEPAQAFGFATEEKDGRAVATMRLTFN